MDKKKNKLPDGWIIIGEEDVNDCDKLGSEFIDRYISSGDEELEEIGLVDDYIEYYRNLYQRYYDGEFFYPDEDEYDDMEIIDDDEN